MNVVIYLTCISREKDWLWWGLFFCLFWVSFFYYPRLFVSPLVTVETSQSSPLELCFSYVQLLTKFISRRWFINTLSLFWALCLLKSQCHENVSDVIDLVHLSLYASLFRNIRCALCPYCNLIVKVCGLRRKRTFKTGTNGECTLTKLPDRSCIG